MIVHATGGHSKYGIYRTASEFNYSGTIDFMYSLIFEIFYKSADIIVCSDHHCGYQYHGQNNFANKQFGTQRRYCT